MIDQHRVTIQLAQKEYVPIIKDRTISYGGNQQWFSPYKHKSSDFMIHHHGSSTIASADLLLYLALMNDNNRNILTNMALQGSESIHYLDYASYIKQLQKLYFKTKPCFISQCNQTVRGLNNYFKDHSLSFRAKFIKGLDYYGMLAIIEDMLTKNLPVILTIGRNSTFSWGTRGCRLYHQFTIMAPQNHKSGDFILQPTEPIYRYREVRSHLTKQFFVVTGIIKDALKPSTMLCVSYQGQPYYLNYDEYRDYVDEHNKFRSNSIVYIMP